MMRFLTLFLTMICVALPATAQDKPRFAFPLDCTLGENCWVLEHVDLNAEDGVSDYSCGARSEDGNQGTDFTVANRQIMQNGVAVKAAADGRILRLRDGLSDAPKTPEELEGIAADNKDCGNGIFIDHGNGLVTVYCHLKNGSILVKEGDQVRQGQEIAAMGASGLTAMPRLHFGIVWEGAVMDPFSGLQVGEECDAIKQSLWRNLDAPYEPLAIFDAGFRTAAPDFEAIKKGEDNPQTLPNGAEALTFWAGYFGAKKGDEIVITITGPNGETFVRRRYRQKDPAARQFYFSGREVPGGVLPTGIYKGHVSITRGNVEKALERTLTIIR